MKLSEELSQRLDLPGQAMPGSVRVEIVDRRRVLIENHRGILHYSQELIEVAAARGHIVLHGSGLMLEAMRGGDLLISGNISGVEL